MSETSGREYHSYGTFEGPASFDWIYHVFDDDNGPANFYERYYKDTY